MPRPAQTAWPDRSHTGSARPPLAQRTAQMASAPLTMNQIIPGTVTGIEVPGTTEYELLVTAWQLTNPPVVQMGWPPA